MRLVMETKPATPAPDVTAAAPAAAPSGFLFQVFHSATAHVKGFSGVVTAIVALVAVVWSLVNPGDKLPPGMAPWVAGSLIGFFLLLGLIDVLLRRLSPWFTALALALWLLGTFVVWPHYQERWAMSELGRLGFSYVVNRHRMEIDDSFVMFSGNDAQDMERWRDILAALRAFRCRNLSLRKWSSLVRLDGLESVTTLEELDLSGCKGLAMLPDLGGMSRLQVIDLTGCTVLLDTVGFQSLAGLERFRKLVLSHCTGLVDTAALASLRQLKTLELSDCTSLKGAAALQGLAGLESLQELNLCGCTGLVDTAALAGLRQLKTLYLSGCTGLKGAAALQGLTGLERLQQLNLFACTGLDKGTLAELRRQLPATCRIYGPDGEEVKP